MTNINISVGVSSLDQGEQTKLYLILSSNYKKKYSWFPLTLLDGVQMYRSYVHELHRTVLREISGPSEKFVRVIATRSFRSLLGKVQSAARDLLWKWTRLEFVHEQCLYILWETQRKTRALKHGCWENRGLRRSRAFPQSNKVRETAFHVAHSHSPRRHWAMVLTLNNITFNKVRTFRELCFFIKRNWKRESRRSEDSRKAGSWKYLKFFSSCFLFWSY